MRKRNWSLKRNLKMIHFDTVPGTRKWHKKHLWTQGADAGLGLKFKQFGEGALEERDHEILETKLEGGLAGASAGGGPTPLSREALLLRLLWLCGPTASKVLLLWASSTICRGPCAHQSRVSTVRWASLLSPPPWRLAAWPFLTGHSLFCLQRTSSHFPHLLPSWGQSLARVCSLLALFAPSGYFVCLILNLVLSGQVIEGIGSGKECLVPARLGNLGLAGPQVKERSRISDWFGTG